MLNIKLSVIKYHLHSYGYFECGVVSECLTSLVEAVP